MFRIGEFSVLSNLSIRTLRYYNDLGILIPDETDPYTGYRYYSDKNLEEAANIANLKQAGFSLEEIKDTKGTITEEVFDYKRTELENKMFYIEQQIIHLENIRRNLVTENKVKSLTTRH